MATKQDRGTKRTCQNSECGSRFYDLNRTPIACPICGAAYVITSSPAAIVIVQPEAKTPRKPKKKVFADAETNEDETAKEDTLDEVEADKTVGNDDETVLEEVEEEGGDVSKILGGTKVEEG
ncbi:MAG: TIGR02300 family protein [Hyphomicrobium sp.]